MHYKLLFPSREGFYSFFALVLASQLILWISAANAQIDHFCTATANGQTVNVNPDGTFRITNIPAGPGLVRVRIVCQRDGKTFYGRSEFFEISEDQNFLVGDVPLSETPLLTTESITAVAAVPILTNIGQTSQIRVMAMLSNGDQIDVTSRALGSTYSSSNTNIATVDQEGLVTAVGAGAVFIAVTNEGTTAVTKLIVAPGDPLTTVEGFVQFEDGRLADGVQVSIVDQPGSSVTDSCGRFSIAQVATSLGPLTIWARINVNNLVFTGFVSGLAPVLGGLTDVGIMTITDDIYWIVNTDGSWHESTNWSLGRVPGPSDDVIINISKDITVTHSQSTSIINSLHSDANVVVFGSVLSIANTSEVNNFDLISGPSGEEGTLLGTGDLTVNGLLRWMTGATMSGSGKTIIKGQMQMSRAPGASSTGLIDRTIDNAGTVSWTSGNISGVNVNREPVFNNLTGAIFDAQADNSFGGVTFNNFGIFRKAGATAITTITPAGAIFNNNGTVEVQSGRLEISVGASAGNFAVKRGGTLAFVGGSHNLNAGSTVTDSGTVEIRSTGNINIFGKYDFPGITNMIQGPLDFHSNATLGVLNLSGGILIGTGDVTVNELLTWTGGTISGTGKTNIGTSGVFNISGSDTKTLSSRTINNAGRATWSDGGEIRGGDDFVFNNLAGAVFEIFNDRSFFGSANIGFENSGLLRKSVGTGETALGTRVRNSGVIEARSGILALSLGYIQTSSGNLIINIGGLTPGSEFGKITIGGAGASLAGTLTINLVNNFQPQLGAQFEIMTFNRRVEDSKFSQINGLVIGNGLVFDAKYDDQNQRLILTVVQQ